MPRHELTRLATGFALLLCAGQPFHAHADTLGARRVHLMVGPDLAVVSEERLMELEKGRQAVSLEGIPPEVDLSTFVVRAQSDRFRLIEWERVTAAHPVNPIRVEPDKDTATWSPNDAAQSTTDTLPAVRCVVEAPEKGFYPLQLTYTMPGLSWRVAYEIVLRGETEGEGEPLSVDIEGYAHIDNASPRSFADAQVTLVAYDPAAEADDPRRDPGFLLLDESNALSDFWLETEPSQPIMFQYRVEAQADIGAGVVTRIPFVKGRRMAAEPLYVMRSEHFPLSTRHMKQPLNKVIVFKNAKGLGLGRALPLGEAQMYTRNRRERLLRGAHIPHTPAGEDIRIDMGPAPDVVGGRANVGSRDVGEGVHMEEFEVTIDNHTPQPIRVEIDEKPPLTLGWDVTRASATHFVKEGRILFRPRVDAQHTERIRYSLRVREPQL